MKWKNLKTIEDLSAKAINGNISPALLLNPAKKSFKGTFSSGGETDLEELARIGQHFMKELNPNSGTLQRAQMAAAIGSPIAMVVNPATIPYIAAPYLGSAAYNLANRAQPLVKRAIKGALKPAKQVTQKTGGPLAAIANANLVSP